MKLAVNRFSALYTVSFASIGVFFPLVAQYLAQLGFSGLEIGVITASSTAVGILANPIWGGLYHRLGNNKKLIMFLCIMTSFLVLFLWPVTTFFSFLLIYVTAFFFENPIFPLIDATTLEAKYPFGVARKWGAVGFASGIGIGGVVADWFGLRAIIPALSGFFLLTVFLLAALAREKHYFPEANGKDTSSSKGKERRGNLKEHYRQLLRNKGYLGILASIFFYMGPSMAHNTYFSFLFLDVGGSVSGMGLALLLMVISEAPFMAWASRFANRFTTERMILFAMILSALRYLWFSTGPGPELLMGTFFLQGFANGIILVEVVKYISKVVRADLLSLAIPLYTAIAANASTITCQLIGGVLVESFGGQGVYLFYGAYNLIGVLIYLLFGLHKSKRNI